MKKIFTLLSAVIFTLITQAQTIEIQFVNNSPIAGEVTGSTFDIYINDSLLTELNDLPFRAASPILNVALSQTMTISIANAESDSSAQSFARFNIGQFVAGERYLLIVNGEFGNPSFPLGLEIMEGLRVDADGIGGAAVQYFNGSFSTGNESFFIQKQGSATNQLSPGSFSMYINQAADLQFLDYYIEDNALPAATFQLDLSAFENQALSIITSGSNTSLPELEMMLVETNGEVTILDKLEIPALVINEVDYNQPGADTEEFIEIFNPTSEQVDLANLSLELWNGSLNEIYNTIEFPEGNIAANDYYVVCFNEAKSYCDLVVAGSIQNGGIDGDAIALNYQGALVDVSSYANNLPNLTEGSADGLVDTGEPAQGLSRIPNGSDSNNNNNDFKPACITPGMPNIDELDCSIQVSSDSSFVQLISNVKDTDVDVYLNGTLQFAGLAFQNASPFFKVPSAVDIDLAVVPAGQGIETALELQNDLQFEFEKAYTIVIDGTSSSGIQSNISNAARVEGKSPFAIDFNFYHGIVTAPALDILLKDVGQVADSLAYSYFSNYRSAIPGTYLFELKPDNASFVLGTFEAILRSDKGTAVTVLISESLIDSSRQELIAVYPSGEVITLEVVEFARSQFINNIPNVVVDVYADGQLIIDDFQYRKATPFFNIRGNRALNIEIRDENSTPTSPVLVRFENVQLDALDNYALMLSGDGTMGREVDLFILENAEVSAQADFFNLAAFHGATDVAPIDIRDPEGSILGSSLAYGSFSNYSLFGATDINFQILESGNQNLLGTYEAVLSQHSGEAGILFSSGVFGGSQTFGAFIAFADGTVEELDFLQFSRLQLVHNAPGVMAIDVYINGELYTENLGFREATAFQDILAEQTLEISMTPTGVALEDSILVSFENVIFIKDSTYQVFANGIPGDDDFPINLFINDRAQESFPTAAALGVAAFHGSPGAPAVEIGLQDGSTLIMDVAYGDFSEYIGVSPTATFLELRAAETGEVIGTFEADLSQVTPSTPLVIFASGLIGANPGFGLFAVLPDGTVIPLVSVDFGALQLINAIPDTPIDVYLDGELVQSNLAYRDAIPYANLRVGEPHEIAIAIGGANSIRDTIASFSNIIPTPNQTFGVIAAGVDNDGEKPIQLFLNSKASLSPGGDNKFSFNFFNGNTDAPELDVILQGITTLYRRVDFGEFTDYTLIEPLSSDPIAGFEIKISDVDPVLRVYRADFSELGNQSITLFGSGYLIDRILPSFEVWVALPDGTTYPLELVTGTSDLLEKIPSIQLAPNPAKDQTFIDFELNEKLQLQYQLLDISGQILQRKDLGVLNAGEHRTALELADLPGGLYFVRLLGNEGNLTLKLIIE